MLQNAFVDGACSEASSDEKDGLLLWIQSERLDGLLTCYGCLDEVLSHWVAGVDDFVCREESVHAVVSHANLLCLGSEMLVGHSGV